MFAVSDSSMIIFLIHPSRKMFVSEEDLHWILQQNPIHSSQRW